MEIIKQNRLDTNHLGDDFIKDAEALYRYNRNIKNPANISYFGSREEDGTKFTTAALRDFIENGENTRRRLDVIMGGLFIKSKKIPKEKQEEAIRAIKMAPDEEAVIKEINEHISGLNDPEKLAFFSAAGKIKRVASSLQGSFDIAGSDQNPFFSKLLEMRGIEDDSEFESKAETIGWNPSYVKNIQKDGTLELYEKEDLIRDAKEAISTRVIGDDLSNMIATIKSNQNPFLMKIKENITDKKPIPPQDLNVFIEDYLKPIVNTEVTPYQKSLRYHNDSAHIARKIVQGAFGDKKGGTIAVGDCIPMFDDDLNAKNVEEYKRNMSGAILGVIKRYKENDPQINAVFGTDKSFETDIAEEVVRNLVTNPSAQMKAAIRDLDERKITPGDKGRTPGAIDEEHLLKVVEDTIYNAVMKKISFDRTSEGEKITGIDLARSLNIPVTLNGDIIDVAENMKQGKYDPSNYTNKQRTELKQARDLYKITEVFSNVQNGKYSKKQAMDELKTLESKVLDPSETAALGNAISSFFDEKQAIFDPSRYGVSQQMENLQMDMNSSVLERQSHEIYKTLYGDKPFTKFLNYIGLEHEKGQEFTTCLGSARTATIKTHSPAHEMKQCVDKLVQAYEKDAEAMTKDLGNPVIAASGLAGLMIIFSIIEKASAQRLKGMIIKLERERKEALEYVSKAKTPQEFVAREMAVRNQMEKVTDEVVAAYDVDRYITEVLWAAHEHDIASNPYLKKNSSLAKMGGASGSESRQMQIGTNQDGTPIYGKREFNRKALMGHSALMEILEASGLKGDIAEMMKKSQEEEMIAYHKALSSKDAAIPSLMAAIEGGDVESIARLTNEIRSKALLVGDGIISGADRTYINKGISASEYYASEKKNLEGIAESYKEMMRDAALKIKKIETSQNPSLQIDELISLKNQVAIFEASLASVSETASIMEERYLSIREIEQLSQERDPFGKAYSAFNDEISFASRYGGAVTSKHFVGSDLMRMDRILNQMQSTNGGKYNSAALGNTIGAIKSVIKETMLQQMSDKNAVSRLSSFKFYEEHFKGEALKSSNMDIRAVKQTNGSVQLVMTDKAAIGDLRKIKVTQQELIDAGYPPEKLVRQKESFVLFDEIQDSYGKKDRLLQEKDRVENLSQSGQISEADKISAVDTIQREIDLIDTLRAEYAARTNLKSISQSRYSFGSDDKKLSNIYNVNLARTNDVNKGGNIFSSMFKSEKLVSTQNSLKA